MVWNVSREQVSKLVAVRRKITDLIDQTILQQLQDSLARQLGIGLLLYDDQGATLTRISQVFPLPENMLHKSLELFRFFYEINNYQPRTDFVDDRTIIGSYFCGLLKRTIVPLYFRGELMGVLCLLKLEENIDLRSLTQMFNSLQETIEQGTSYRDYLDADVLQPPRELFYTLDKIKQQIYSFFEAGWERAKYQESNQAPNGEFELIKSDLIIFTNPKGEIMHATTVTLQLLGYESATEMLGLNVIRNLILDSKERDQIIRGLAEDGELEWIDIQLEKKDGATIRGLLKVVPQRDEKKTVGYEFHVKVAKEFLVSSEAPSTEPQGFKIVSAPFEESRQTMSRGEESSKNEQVDTMIQSNLSAEIHESKLDPDKPIHVASVDQKTQEIFITYDGISEVLDRVAYPLICLDDKQEICIWNKSVEKIFEIPAASVLEMPLDKILLSSSVASWKEWLEKIQRTEPEIEFRPPQEIGILSSKGHIIRAQIALTKTLILQREFITVTIVEWEKEIPRTNLKRDKFLKSAYDSELDPLIITDNKENILHINSVALHFLEISDSRDIPANFKDFFVSQSHPAIDLAARSATQEEPTTIVAQLDSNFKQGAVIQIHARQVGGYDRYDHRVLWSLEEYEAKFSSDQEHAAPGIYPNYRQLEAIRPSCVQIHKEIKRIADDLNRLSEQLSGEETAVKSVASINKRFQNRIQGLRRMENALLHFTLQSEPHVTVLDLGVLLSQNQNQLRQDLRFPDTIQINWMLDSQIAKIEADPAHLLLLLQILLENALEALGDTGEIVVRTGSRYFSNSQLGWFPNVVEGEFVNLTVSDNGPGLSNEILHRLFEPFVTSKATPSDRGFGLAAVIGIVIQAKGFISVETQKDKGTTFHIFFPAKIEPSMRQRKATITAHNRTIEILLFEEKPSLTEQDVQILKTKGLDAIFAKNGPEALQILSERSDKIGMVVIDAELSAPIPIRSAEAVLNLSPQMPIIFTSKKYPQKNFLRFLQNTDSIWLKKPYTLAKLLQAIQEIQAKRQN